MKYIIIVAASVCVLACADLLLRARHAYQEGEKYMRWHADPSLKLAYYDEKHNQAKAALDADLAAGRITDAEHKQRLVLADVRHEEGMEGSSLKYAYHWYKTAAELFSPPQSRWTRLSREKMAEAKRLWKQELDAAKIPYQDYQLE